MDLEIDESKIFYGLGSFLGVISILYFGHELILDLSPTIKSFILLSSTAMFLGAAEYVRNGVLKSSFYVFSSFSYLSFLVYMFARFSFSSEQIFLILAASSTVFVGLGYFRSEKGYSLNKEQSKKVLGAVITLVAVAVVFDVMGSQPEYSLELHESVEVVEGEEFEIGVFEIRNDFVLSRNVDVPTFRGCLYMSEDHEPRNIYIHPDDPGLIGGGETERTSLADTVNSPHRENVTYSGNYSVVRGQECPSDAEERTIYISEGEEFEMLRSEIRD